MPKVQSKTLLSHCWSYVRWQISCTHLCLSAGPTGTQGLSRRPSLPLLRCTLPLLVFRVPAPFTSPCSISEWRQVEGLYINYFPCRQLCPSNAHLSRNCSKLPGAGFRTPPYTPGFQGGQQDDAWREETCTISHTCIKKGSKRMGPSCIQSCRDSKTIGTQRTIDEKEYERSTLHQ